MTDSMKMLTMGIVTGLVVGFVVFLGMRRAACAAYEKEHQGWKTRTYEGRCFGTPPGGLEREIDP